MALKVPHRTTLALVFLTLLGAAAAALVLRRRGDEPPRVPLDLVLVTLDTTRADAFGCYGASAGASPRIDELARGGVLFERCGTSSAITPVAHATLLTGLQPYQHGLRLFTGKSGYRLPEHVPTLATVLDERGYTTLAVHSAFPVSASFGFDRGFHVFESFEGSFVGELAAEPEAPRSEVLEGFQRRSDETIDLALTLLDRAEGPTFLWVHLFDAHDAKLRPPDEFLGPIAALDAAADSGYREVLYAEEVRYQDAQLGRLLDGLRDRKAVVAVVADHGEGLAGGLARHGWYRHAVLYEDQLHVPLVLSGPGLPAGRRVSSQVRTVDLMPTLLELVGAPVPAAVVGASLLPLVHHGGSNRPIYAEQLSGYELVPPRVLKLRPQDDFVYSMSDGRWKLLYRPAQPSRSELFDLDEDPGETLNVFGWKPEVQQRLLRELALRDPWLDAEPDLEGLDPNPAFTEAIAALGYAADGAAHTVTPSWEWSCLSDGTRTGLREPCPKCGEPRVQVAAGESPVPRPKSP